MQHWSPRVDWPTGVVAPRRVDPSGATGPTPRQARGPAWVRTSHGLHVPAATDRSVVEQRILEQASRLGNEGAVTGWAALRIAGAAWFDGLAADGRTPLPIPLVVPPRTRWAADDAVALLRADVPTVEVRMLHGMRVTLPARALLDEVRQRSDLREAVVALDMALVAGLVSFDALDSFLAAHAGLRGIDLMRRARGLATDRSASPTETRMRLIWLLDAGLPVPRCNWPVADAQGRFLGRPDLLCPELGVYGEFDGRAHRSRTRHRQDVWRTESFLAVGLEGFTIVGSDLADRALVVGRMRSAVARAEGRPRQWLLQQNPRPLWR